MPPDFEKQTAEENEFLHEFARELGVETDEAQAVRILIAFFRTLRNHLTPEENFQLLAQLPLTLKRMYADQWNISSDTSHSQTINEFIIEMVKADEMHAYSDFQSLDRARMIISKLLRVWEKHTAQGKLKDMFTVLPRGLRKLFTRSTDDMITL